ncbi:TRAP transporter large permease subunit [Allobacillus sp. SKP2-8]|uniref:TRAP transporter large permease subunit n=1 Tax=Allobacillus halotolerans TaxID=570278 RepID=A0ABS6GR40_9BACI|nr:MULTISPECIES: Na+/H+ antiporter NhaC family protein [Allobacillus]MBU6081597.1 TRAP transporter large permease subunit [Allobacillus halotolerans]TSJ66926.1 TRAP transporter large permease subunit [Allobacillus sp. SKP2-8]
MAFVVIASVLIMVILSLLKVNVLLAIVISALSAGLMSGLSLADTVALFVENMGGSANTALSYVLLGGFAVAISLTGITTGLVQFLRKAVKGKRGFMLIAIALIASLSQNAVPVHIAFVPILIPPLIALFDKMQLDRRAVATSLVFGLKAPYVMLPIGFGLIFQGIIRDNMVENGIEFSLNEVTQAMLIPGAGMIVGLLIALFITYRKKRDYSQIQASETASSIAEESDAPFQFETKHFMTLIAIVAALVVQILTGEMVLGALTGLLLMFILVAVPFKRGEEVMAKGIGMMGMIAFIMLAASGFGEVLKQTGSVEALVDASSGMLEGNKALISMILLLVGLLITMGIGTSFGTIPIIAALYVPIALAAGFSPMAIAVLIGTAGALGDAGSPASDSTLGATAGLNVDGKHNHIWDTCVPTFIHFNIPLLIFGWAASLFL